MSKFLALFQGEVFQSPPLWFMRQAGRSLPEYLEVRKTCKTFLDLCYSPELAAKVTLQPLERFGFDAAILFSDILVIPDALGQRVSFEEGKGPRLSPLYLSSFQKSLSFSRFFEKLTPVYEAIRLVKDKASPLIGFSGAPWTLALYMLEGEGTRDFGKAKQIAFSDEEAFSNFLTFEVLLIFFLVISLLIIAKSFNPKSTPIGSLEGLWFFVSSTSHTTDT